MPGEQKPHWKALCFRKFCFTFSIISSSKPDVADKTAELYLDNGYDYNKLKNSLSSEIDFAGDLNSSSEMKLHLATVLIKKVLSKLEI